MVGRPSADSTEEFESPIDEAKPSDHSISPLNLPSALGERKNAPWVRLKLGTGDFRCGLLDQLLTSVL